MTTLVTGATGFIGRRLIRHGERALVRCSSGFTNEVVGDLADVGSLERACNGIDTVFHCAGQAQALSYVDRRLVDAANRIGTKNLLAAAVRAGVKRLVFLSSVKAMADSGERCVDEDWPGEPESEYGRSKRAAELEVLDTAARSSMHVVNLRLAMVYGSGGRGNLERLAQGLLAGWFPILPDTGNRRSVVHVDDVIAAMRCVAGHPKANGHTYIVADPRAYSGREICDAIRAVGPVPKISWHVPTQALRWAGKLGDLAEQGLSRQLPIDSRAVSSLLDSACYSPARIEAELGWRAKISLSKGLREMLG